MANPKWARGDHAWGYCQKSGIKMLLKDMVMDGHHKGLMVHPDYYDPVHPQEKVINVSEGVALREMSPPTNREKGTAKVPNYDFSNDRTNGSFLINHEFGSTPTFFTIWDGGVTIWDGGATFWDNL
jgi:hypothetical protein